MSLYDTPAWTSFNDLFSYGNTVTNSMFGNVFILAVFLVSFIAMKNYGAEKAFLGSSVFCFMVALVSWSLGFVQGLAVAVTLGMTVMGLIINWRGG